MNVRFGVFLLAAVTCPAVAAFAAVKEKVIFSFNGTNGGPSPNTPTIDAKGNLFLTTGGGGQAGQGAFVELSPPAKGQTAWTETVLYSFQGGSDGAAPSGGLLSDGSGNYYASTGYGGGNGSCTSSSGCGALVKLTAPSSG